MEQRTQDHWKPADHGRTAEAVVVPLLCVVGAVALLAAAGYIWMIAVWSVANGG